MALASLLALQEAQKLSSGLAWLYLITIEHELMPMPLRLASPSLESVLSQGFIFLPSRFDVELPTESFEQLGRARLVLDGVDGVLLDALQQLPSTPTIKIQVVLETQLDTVQAQVQDLEIEGAVRVEGASRLSADLVSSRFSLLPFPGINMDRTRVPGIFTDVA